METNIRKASNSKFGQIVGLVDWIDGFNPRKGGTVYLFKYYPGTGSGYLFIAADSEESITKYLTEGEGANERFITEHDYEQLSDEEQWNWSETQVDGLMEEANSNYFGVLRKYSWDEIVDTVLQFREEAGEDVVATALEYAAANSTTSEPSREAGRWLDNAAAPFIGLPTELTYREAVDGAINMLSGLLAEVQNAQEMGDIALVNDLVGDLPETLAVIQSTISDFFETPSSPEDQAAFEQFNAFVAVWAAEWNKVLPHHAVPVFPWSPMAVIEEAETDFNNALIALESADRVAYDKARFERRARKASAGYKLASKHFAGICAGLDADWSEMNVLAKERFQA